MDILESKQLCLRFNQFMLDKFDIPAELKSAYSESNKLIEKAFVENNIKPLKAMISDINQQVKYMPLKLAMELKGIIKKELDFDLEVVDKMQENIIKKAIKKGKITSIDEYDLLLIKVDDLTQVDPESPQIELFNAMILEYEQKQDKP